MLFIDHLTLHAAKFSWHGLSHVAHAVKVTASYAAHIADAAAAQAIKFLF